MKQKYILAILLFLVAIAASGQIQHKLTFTDHYCVDIVTLKDSSIYSNIRLPKIHNLSKVGMPELPQKILKFLIPENASDLWIEIVEIKTEKFKIEHPLKPGKEPTPTGTIEEKPTMYQTFDKEKNKELVYPEMAVNIEGVGKMREFNIATVSIYPFQYFAVQKKLLFIKEVEFILHYQIEGKELTVKQFNDKDKIIQENVCSYISNKDDFHKFYQTAENNISRTVSKSENSQLKSTTTGITLNCDYVVVTTDNYVAALSEFTAWKRRKGIKIEVVSINNILSNYTGDIVSGIYDNPGKLRQFLNDTYSNSQCFQYAIFIDDGNIPIRYLHHDNDETDPVRIYPSDYYFADFDVDWEKDGDTHHGESDDLIYSYEPDIFVGRLLVQNTDELKNWIRKVILYETDPGKGNRDYLTKAYFTDADHLRSEIITDELEWCYTVKVDFEDGGYNTDSTPSFPTGSDVIYEFNNHYGVAGFCAHGRPTAVGVASKGMPVFEPISVYGVTSLDEYNDTSNSGCCLIPENGNGFDNMTNINHPTIFLSISCQTMPFDDFGHNSSIRNMGESYTVMSKGGGPVYIGNTRDGFCTPTNTIIGEMMRRSSETTIYNLGKLMAYAKENNISTNNFIKYSLNLLGCPETELWTAIPYPFQGVTVTQNGSNVTINTYERGTRFTVMSALDNGNSYYQTYQDIYTDSWTFYNVPTPYLVTITKHNFIPYILNPVNLYFQNELVYSEKYIYAENIYAGENVTTSKPQGIFKVMNGANVTFDASNGVYLEHGFEVELGGVFEAK